MEELITKFKSANLSFGSKLWSSFKTRVSRELTINEGVDYIILKFVCDDRDANGATPTIITKAMYEEQQKRFNDLLEQVKKT